MSLEILRSLATVLAFVAFIAICLWAYSSKRRDDFDAAANLPFADDENDPHDSSTRKDVSSHKERGLSSHKEKAA